MSTADSVAAATGLTLLARITCCLQSDKEASVVITRTPRLSRMRLAPVALVQAPRWVWSAGWCAAGIGVGAYLDRKAYVDMVTTFGKDAPAKVVLIMSLRKSRPAVSARSCQWCKGASVRLQAVNCGTMFGGTHTRTK